MKKIENCIYKQNNCFYLDILKWQSISDISIEIGDIFEFIFEYKKYNVKVIDINNFEAKLKIL